MYVCQYFQQVHILRMLHEQKEQCVMIILAPVFLCRLHCVGFCVSILLCDLRSRPDLSPSSIYTQAVCSAPLVRHSIIVSASRRRERLILSMNHCSNIARDCDGWQETILIKLIFNRSV